MVYYRLIVGLFACILCPFTDSFVPHHHIRSTEASALQAALSEEDEELIRLIRGPMGAKTPRPKPKTILILSDTTGVTAKSAVEKSLEQFNGCDERFYALKWDSDDGIGLDEDDECVNLSTKLFPFLKTEQQVADILKDAAGWDALVVFTLAEPDLREATIRMCQLSKVAYVDLLGPMFDGMSQLFNRAPLGKAASTVVQRRRQSRALSDSYYRRVEAVEFTLNCDDGMKPRLWKDADIVLLGVSRTGKAPLSVVLAQTMGLKVANVPLVVDLDPPPQLFQIDPQRVFLLTLSLTDLQRIRKNRLSREMRKATNAESNYADLNYLERDLEHSRQIAREYGYKEIDVTGRAVEETASYISSVLNRRFPEDRLTR